jgi:hypothetical protein
VSLPVLDIWLLRGRPCATAAPRAPPCWPASQGWRRRAVKMQNGCHLSYV